MAVKSICPVCSVPLRSDNKIGYCRKHKSQSPIEKARRAAHYLENKETYQTNGAAWRARNKERIKSNDRAYYAQNSEAIKSRVAKWVEENPDLRKAIARKYATVRRARLVELFVEDVDMTEVYNRDMGVCHLCGRQIASVDDASPDHVIPLSKGGPHCMDNVAASHRMCNFKKGATITSPNPVILARAQSAFNAFHATPSGTTP